MDNSGSELGGLTVRAEQLDPACSAVVCETVPLAAACFTVDAITLGNSVRKQVPKCFKKRGQSKR